MKNSIAGATKNMIEKQQKEKSSAVSKKSFIESQIPIPTQVSAEKDEVDAIYSFQDPIEVSL